MRIGWVLLVLCLAAVLIPGVPASGAGEAPASGGAETAGAAEAVNAFAVDVYLRLAQKEGEFFFSPYSISSALAMVYAGADGETAREMGKTLHLAGLPRPHLAMKALTDRFGAIRGDADYGKNGVFDAANRVWVDREEELLPDYTAFVGLGYGAAAEPLDFKRDANGARKAINEWTARETRGKIRDLLREGDVDRTTRLVLTNAVYFSSEWVK
ncbi:MAG: hypothetical protein LBO82_08170, partial [Synergistaceae bacterium]|nr:hypothetical protein [Synergistaceae bacterium]